MKKLKLTNGLITLVDNEDFVFLNQWNWNAWLIHGHWYAVRKVWNKQRAPAYTVTMHRQIMGVSNPKILIDHKDRDSLNNQKVNLRLCTTSQNCSNKNPSKNGSSKYLGVCWDKSRKKWRADIEKKGKGKFLGHFLIEKNAAKAYNKAAKIIHGEFANLNKV